MEKADIIIPVYKPAERFLVLLDRLARQPERIGKIIIINTERCHLDELIPEKELYGGHAIWRYSNEQVWKWIPVYRAHLEKGEHLLQALALSSRLRFEQIYLTKGKGLPGEI